MNLLRILLLAGIGWGDTVADAASSDAAAITEAGLARHIETLASDRFAGRAPGTDGETRTVAYLEAAFRAAGAAGGVDGEYRQSVPMIEVSRDGPFEFAASGQGVDLPLEPFADVVVFDGDADGAADIAAAPLVFVGYGITAAEYGWDDYAGSRVDGAIVVLLRGEPSRDDDEHWFMGRNLTPHYHPDVKFERAAERGAIGAVLIHTDESAGWPWSLLQGGGAGNSQSFLRDANAAAKPDATVQISEPAARRLLAAGGYDYDALVAAAQASPAGPLELGLDARLRYSGKLREYASTNVVARIAGTARPEECVLYTAHWDHVGTDEALDGDRIFNGAVDNATGTAALIELAEAFAGLDSAPRRSVYLVATTAEEKGLLGARYLVSHPVCAPARTVAVLNMDSHFPFGSFDAMTVVGFGFSEVQAAFERAAARLGRILQPDGNPEVGAFYRNDAYPFAAAGIPAVYAVGGPRLEDWDDSSEMAAQFEDYVTNRYHKPADEYDADSWDLAGIREDTQIFFDAGLELANDSRFPNWRYDLPQRRLRDAMMAP